MELDLSDWDDYNKLDEKLSKIDKTLSLLVQCLDIPKIYKVAGQEFDCVFDAEKFAKKCGDDFRKTYAGGTGCIPQYTIDVMPYPFGNGVVRKLFDE